MELSKIRVGLCVTGSFCNFSKLDQVILNLQDSGVAEILPIVSNSCLESENRFSTPNMIKEKLERLTGNKIIDTIAKAEPIGPKDMLDILLVLPCTGNTLGKLSHGITDGPVLMAIKSHIRNNKPVVIGVSTNDGLGASAENIGRLLNTKNMYFIPFNQDDPHKKPKSVVCDYTKTVDTLKEALKGKQIQPVLI